MEGTGEISDTDSGIILHCGSDSPTTHTKDVTTHTRAMKLKHQSLQDQLERCILELKKLCIREAELTGQLSEDYPLQPGEKPPLVRRRIGAAFRLDEQSIPQGAEESELNLVDAELALQVKIYEAARKLCREDHLNKAVKKSRVQQCKREEKKLKELQEASFQLRLEHGRSSPRPAYKITLLDQGTSDDSSLSDSAVHEEEVTSQPSQPDTSLGPPPPGETEPLQPLLVSSQSSIDSSYIAPSEAPQPLPLTPCQSPHPSLHSTPSYDAPPIQNSPWAESSLDQPYQKIKKSRSSTKSKSSSPSTSEVLPPLEACLQHSPLPSQLSHLKLSHSQSSSTPTTPELRVHRQLSLRLSAESSFGPEKDRGRSRYPRRRLTDYTVTLPEPPALREKYRSHASSEDSNSEHSSTSYTSSPCREMPCDLSKQCPSAFQHQRCGQVGSLGPPAFPNTSFYQNSRHQSSPSIHKRYYSEEVGYPFDVEMPRSYYGQQAPCPSNRYDYWFQEGAVHPQRAQRAIPHDVRLSPSPWDHPHYRSPGLPRQVVNEELMSWHWRSKCKGPRPRSLDRQGAVRFKNTAAREFTLSQNQRYHEQISQRQALQRAADDSPVQWCVEENSETVNKKDLK